MKYNAQKKYKRDKVKTRHIDFYPHDEEIYIISRQINFQRFVKMCLRNYDLINKELYYVMNEVENGKEDI